MTLQTLARIGISSGITAAALAALTGTSPLGVVIALWLGTILGVGLACLVSISADVHRQVARERQQAHDAELLEALWREPWDNRR